MHLRPSLHRSYRRKMKKGMVQPNPSCDVLPIILKWRFFSRDVLEIASILTSLSDKTSKSIDKPHKHVRRRRTTAPPERDLLLKIFEVDGVLWPSREARQELAKQLHMTPRQVQVWYCKEKMNPTKEKISFFVSHIFLLIPCRFQNQRAKIKQKTQTNA